MINDRLHIIERAASRDRDVDEGSDRVAGNACNCFVAKAADMESAMIRKWRIPSMLRGSAAFRNPNQTRNLPNSHAEAYRQVLFDEVFHNDTLRYLRVFRAIALHK